MAPTQEPIAVLGIGTMGHGMATSSLRAGIPTIVWSRKPETDPKHGRVRSHGILRTFRW
jgi:3-hydroxyisobutyrate dehydrogenase-like beta-hydroxyacid dehydrogenase